jgi:hypothetical protein
MKLESARQLKEELLRGITGRLAVRGDGKTRSIAIGVAPAKPHHDYRIAVRPRTRQDLAGLRTYLDDRTAGEMEIRITGPIRAAGCSTLCVGASVSREKEPRRTGSLGFFARRNRDGVVGFVSNNHILAGEDAGLDGDIILHPGRADQRRAAPSGIAFLDGRYPRLKGGRGLPLDCAFACLIDHDAVTTAPHFGPPAVALTNIPVTKTGRSTAQTYGRVTAFYLDRCDVDYRRAGRIRFQGEIEIESRDEFPFACGGDSGSLILTEDGSPLALIHSVSAAGGYTHNSGLTFAHPIQSVLRALDVSFI